MSIFVRIVVVSKSDSASPAADYINNLILSNDMSGGFTLAEINECVRFAELAIEACGLDIRDDLSIEYIYVDVEDNDTQDFHGVIMPFVFKD